MQDPLSFHGHVGVSVLAGNASLTIYRHAGPVCLPFMSLVLDPAEVRRLAREFRAAAEPPTPARPAPTTRIRVVQNSLSRLWGFDCPACPDYQGLWIDHSAAVSAADRHARHHTHQETR